MDAVLTPHRSLSLHAFRWMIAAFAAVNAVVALVFILHGAYPVVGFMGLDVAALWLAFHLNYRAARRQERVQVAAGHIHLERRTQKGADHWVVSPLWARVSHDGPAGVRIASAGGVMRVGAFLSPREQGAFACALEEALRRAKRS